MYLRPAASLNDPAAENMFRIRVFWVICVGRGWLTCQYNRDLQLYLLRITDHLREEDLQTFEWAVLETFKNPAVGIGRISSIPPDHSPAVSTVPCTYFDYCCTGS